jgi:hypothetical protein
MSSNLECPVPLFDAKDVVVIVKQYLGVQALKVDNVDQDVDHRIYLSFLSDQHSKLLGSLALLLVVLLLACMRTSIVMPNFHGMSLF